MNRNALPQEFCRLHIGYSGLGAAKFPLALLDAARPLVCVFFFLLDACQGIVTRGAGPAPSSQLVFVFQDNDYLECRRQWLDSIRD